MRLHGPLVAALLLAGGIASAQDARDRPKTAEPTTRAKKDDAAHAPLFLEQKDLPTTSKAAMHEPGTPRLFAKSKD